MFFAVLPCLKVSFPFHSQMEPYTIAGDNQRPFARELRLSTSRLEFSQSEDGFSKRSEAFRNDGFDNRKIGVVIVVDEYVAQSSNFLPRDSWFMFEQCGIKMLDCFADLHQSHPTRVVDKTLLKAINREVPINGCYGVENIAEPLLIVTGHNEEASANTSSLTK